jgi:hypothetical protein
VTVAVPVVAVLLAVNVKVLLPVVLAGLKLAVTPEGRPEADRLTLLLKPFTGLTVIVLVPLPPCVTETLVGDAESVKFGVAAAFTVRLIVVVWVKLPDVPVTVTVAVPVVAVLLAVSVKVLLVVVLPGLKLAVTPEGKPEADRLTLPLKPFTGLTVMVLVPLPPCVTVTLVGEADRPKSGVATAFTVRVTVVLWLKLPDVPVIVTVAVPVVAVPLAVSVKVLLPVVLAGLKLAVTPEGKPEADRLTLPLKPFTGLTVMVLVPLPPWVTETLVGEADRLKSGVGAAFTVRVTVVVWLKLPDVPVIVTVAVPVVAVPLAVSVKVLLPVVLAGLKLALTPAGRPEADRLTLPVKPLSGFTVIVLVPLPPCVTVTLAGDADNE